MTDVPCKVALSGVVIDGKIEGLVLLGRSGVLVLVHQRK